MSTKELDEGPGGQGSESGRLNVPTWGGEKRVGKGRGDGFITSLRRRASCCHLTALYLRERTDGSILTVSAFIGKRQRGKHIVRAALQGLDVCVERGNRENPPGAGNKQR